MSKNHVAVMSVVSGSMSVAQASREFGISRQHVYRLVARYRAEGPEGLEPRSRAPRSHPNQTPARVRERIIALRRQLVGEGLDAGPLTIAWHLERDGVRPPAHSTIRRILHQAGLVRPEPDKRPRSSFIRFNADLPNQTWQSDVTHWQLADGTPADIISWLDDHSRCLLHISAHRAVSVHTVLDTFTATIALHGPPASTLTDNGIIYTTRLLGGPNSGPNRFELFLEAMGIVQKNGGPHRPTTQGKIERFHQTLKRRLNAKPDAHDIADLQTVLEDFQDLYNHRRPHTSLARRTPGDVYRASPKDRPDPTAPRPVRDSDYRVKHVRVPRAGVITLRHHGAPHALGVGAAHAGISTVITLDATTVTVIDPTTGQILSTHHIDPDRRYWPNTQRPPGRWPKHDP